MKSLSALLSRTALTLTAGLALGACSRSEYALLPRSASYLGTAPAALHHTAPGAPAPLVVAPMPAPATTEPAMAAARPAATSAAPAPAAAASPKAPAAAAPAPARPNLAQRLALKSLSRKLDKLTARAPQLKQQDAAASTARINGNLRTGIILLVIGLLVGLLNGLIGTIIAIIGLVFILLWLLDEL